MTRINIVPPSELSDKHLGAEYRELPRVFGLVQKAIDRGEKPTDTRNPAQYVLGAGHVRFFYPRLGYLADRHKEIVAECKKRGRRVNYDTPLDSTVTGIPADWYGGYEPTHEARVINRQRIKDRS